MIEFKEVSPLTLHDVVVALVGMVAGALPFIGTALIVVALAVLTAALIITPYPEDEDVWLIYTYPEDDQS